MQRIKIMGILLNIRCKIAQFMGKLSRYLIKLGSGMGKSFPGYIYLSIGKLECVKHLALNMKIGSVIITGTNGKTTTTKITALLLGKDTKITYNYESNTINAIITGLLAGKANLGVFEYGIRDIKHAIPDTVCRIVDPVGVVYTNVSREHSQVSGIKNPFEQYLKAKQLLSTPMKRGIVISNADDPRTTYISREKEEDVQVNYYGLDIHVEDKTPITGDVFCPNCGNRMKYSKRYLNHRGIYKCSCGFSRPEPHLKISHLSTERDSWQVEFSGELLNYPTDRNVALDFTVDVPAFGVHNLYNLLCAVTTYASFTPHPEKIQDTVKEVCRDLDLSILPPGRFEIFQIGRDKLVGMGQGDNGDALKANIQFMQTYVGDEIADNTAFIYTTPDEGEDEIFEDHLSSLIALNPRMVHVVPGRESVEAARKYYEIIEDSIPADFYPLSHGDMQKRIEKIRELVEKSPYKYVVVSGCGPEQYMWGNLKASCKSE
jgi:lipid II isoglutaminyl synthase (glutamine-hydrolysing)